MGKARGVHLPWLLLFSSSPTNKESSSPANKVMQWPMPSVKACHQVHNRNRTIKHDYVLNTLKGGDQTHRLATLSQMYQTMARKVRDAQEQENENEGGAMAADWPTSILENIPLAKEHLPYLPGHKHHQGISTTH
jgi:hypothetical protein